MDMVLNVSFGIDSGKSIGMWFPIYLKLIMFLLSVLNVQTQHVAVGNYSLNQFDVKSPNPWLEMDHFMTLLNESQDEFIIREYCPSNYCGHSSSPDIETAEDKVCCMSCDCSYDCLQLGNCCHDLKPPSTPMYFDEVFEMCTQTTIGNIDVMTDYPRSSYLLYQHCSQQDDQSLVQQCMNPVGENIHDLLPVFSNLTGRHYRNVFCAMCNNDDGPLIKWTQEFRCMKYVNLWFVFNDALRLKQSVEFVTNLKTGFIYCVLELRPTVDQTSLTRCLHNEDIIARCDTSSVYYNQLYDKCESYYAPIFDGAMTFLNIFCRMCNEQISPKTNCFGAEGNVDLSTYVLTQTFSDEAYTSISFGDKMPPNRECSMPTVYNEILDTCIEIRCPISMIEEGNTCVAPFKRVANINLDFRITVMFSDKETYNSTEMLQEALSLFDHVAFNHSVCKTSIKSIFNVNGTVSAQVQVVTYLNELYNLEVANIEFMHSIRLYNANKSNIYTMDVGQEKIFASTTGFFLFPYEDEFGATCESIGISRLLFCPLAALEPHEILPNDNAIVRDKIFRPHEYIYDTVTYKFFICLDDYIEAHLSVAHSESGVMNGSSGPLHYRYSILSLALIAKIISSIGQW